MQIQYNINMEKIIYELEKLKKENIKLRKKLKSLDMLLLMKISIWANKKDNILNFRAVLNDHL